MSKVEWIVMLLFTLVVFGAWFSAIGIGLVKFHNVWYAWPLGIAAALWGLYQLRFCIACAVLLFPWKN